MRDSSPPAPGERVALVVMPWASPMFPGLGPALLRSRLQQCGFECDIVYGSLLFSAEIAGDAFFEQYLAKLPISELAFTPWYFDTDPEAAANRLFELVEDVTDDREVRPLPAYTGLVEAAGRTIDRLAAEVDWSAYDIVGFSVMMQQTVPSLAMARRIREISPGTTIVFGGPNCSAPMGAEMIRSFPEIDYVVDGEADDVLPDLVAAVRGDRAGTHPLPGLLWRGPDGDVRQGPEPRPVTALDDLPVPDYRPFFEQLERYEIVHCQPYLQMETSRGCWWGQRKHCSFCSLDDRFMGFRSKSHQRVIDEVVELSATNHYVDFFPTDSIIDARYYKTLLPELGRVQDEYGFDFSFFFEAKSSIRRSHSQLLRRAGVSTVQPGIESFSDHVLHLMDKGTTGIRQFQCLKFLAEAGIEAWWNLIYANPGETARDYDDILDILPFMHHLPPLHADGYTPMLLMRFSPYHLDPGRHGLSRIRPDRAYDHIFPDDRIDRETLAFYFTYEHENAYAEELTGQYTRVRDALAEWRRRHRPDSLLEYRGRDTVQIVDRRDCDDPAEPAVVTVLRGTDARVFTACDHERSADRVVAEFAGSGRGAAGVERFLADMVARRLAYRSPSGRIITTPLLPAANTMAIEEPAGTLVGADLGLRPVDVA